MNNRYLAFGLKIKSEIEFSELMFDSGEDPADLQISLGKVPASLENARRYVQFEVNEHEFLYKMYNVANYLLIGQEQIVIEPQTDDYLSIRLFLLSNVMAAALYRRQYILLHSSAIIHENELILFCGPSGAGKSTLAALLKNRGYQVFSDDVCILRQTDSGVEVGNTYPVLKLWEDSLQHFKQERQAAANNIPDYQIRPEIKKFAVSDYADFTSERLKIKKIYLLDRAANDYSLVSDVSPKAQFTALIKNVYRPRFAEAMNLQTVQFQIITDLCRSVVIANLHRPDKFAEAEFFLDLLEKDFNR